MISFADAIIEEQVTVVKDFLRQGVFLNQLDEYGYTPLIEAAIADNIEIAECLIAAGADVNLQDSIGGTPLHWAVENNNYSLCELLLKEGANPNVYTLAGQPVMVMAFLRQQQKLKQLLMRAGANLDFTQDFINTKLMGHLFELVGTADIVDPYNQYVEVDFEGFYLEVTLGMIAESLMQFKMNFGGRQIRRYASVTAIVIDSIYRAAELIKYQQYRIDIKKFEEKIDVLIQEDPLVIPVGYEGHAITFIKYGSILVKCDRREDSRLYDNVVFYQMNRPELLSAKIIKKIIFEKQSSDMINHELPTLLALQPITELKVTAQISGNCSWANVEACIPALYFLLFSGASDFREHIPRYKNLSLDFFHQWREWNKDRTLNFCIQGFRESDSIRKACKAEMLVAILFQCCNEESPKSQERAEAILSVLAGSRFAYVLQNYVKTYCFEDKSAEGEKFLQLLKSHGAV